MKRLLGSDSDSLLLSEGYGPMMDEDGAEEELGGGLGCGGGGGGGGGEKKRRLSAEQVRALEKNFEVENKLEPERKARLAQELGLQPRQVAVWFQNRRARWKTKQLERDYGALKARYDALRADRDALLLDKESLLAEVKALKSKVGAGAGAGVGEESSSFTSVKEEEASPELEEPIAPPTLADDNEPVTVIFTKPDVGSSDSDSSAVVNDADHSPLLTASTATTTTMAAGVDFTHNFFYQTLMKVEDSHGFDVDEPCSSFFSDEPPPTLPWYADHWN